MAEKFSVHLTAAIEGEDVVDAFAILMDRLGNSDFYVHDVKQGSTGLWVPSARLTAVLEQARELFSARDPKNCEKDVCCKGIVRWHGKPVCQLSTLELTELVDVTADMADKLPLPGLRRVVRRVAKLLTKNL